MDLYSALGKCTFKPHGCDVNRGIKAVLFRLLNDTVTGFDGGIRQLQLNGNSRRHIKILDLLRLKNLHHNDVFIGKAAEINHVVFSHQGVALVIQFCHIFLRLSKNNDTVIPAAVVIAAVSGVQAAVGEDAASAGGLRCNIDFRLRIPGNDHARELISVFIHKEDR